MRSHFILICSAFLAFSGVSRAQTSAPTPATTKPVTPKVAKAFWTEALQASMGISQDDFASMGLGKLSLDEYIKLMGWAVGRESQATRNGETVGKGAQKAISDAQPTFTCGPAAKDEAEFSKVHLLISGGEQNSPEVMSSLRSKLRSISDVRIVYDAKDADLIIDVLSYAVQSANANIGYATSVSTSQSCTARIGTTEWSLTVSKNHILQTGGRDVNPAVEEIVSSLDARDFEDVRKDHATFKKYLNK